MQRNDFLNALIISELEDAIGVVYCSAKQIDKTSHSVDYYSCYANRGETDMLVWFNARY